MMLPPEQVEEVVTDDSGCVGRVGDCGHEAVMDAALQTDTNPPDY